jgi:hypothetical protein
VRPTRTGSTRPSGKAWSGFVRHADSNRLAHTLQDGAVRRRTNSDARSIRLDAMENGHNKNPTLDTLWCYAAAVGRRLVLTTQAIRDTRPGQVKANRARTARES